MATTEIAVPDIGDYQDVPVIEVHVAPGDVVAEEDPLVTLESDKATMDVPATAAGKVQDVRVKVGDTVSEGTWSWSSAATAPGLTTPPSLVDQQEPAPRRPRAARPPRRPRRPRRQPRPRPPSAPAAPAGAIADISGAHAGPSVRRLARELDLDLNTIKGSGEKGRIVKDDLLAAVRGPAAPSAAPAAAAGAGIPEIPAQDFSKFGPVETVPLPRIKKLSGPFLHRSWLNVPHVTHNDEADITELDGYRRELDTAAKAEGYRVTLLAFLMKAAVSALRQFPEVNSSLSPEKDSLILKRYHHIGIAVDTPGGLVVPVIRDVGAKGIIELSKELGTISQKARDGKLTPPTCRAAPSPSPASAASAGPASPRSSTPRGGDPGRGPGPDLPGLGRRGVPAQADAAGVAVLRPPGDRRRPRRPLHPAAVQRARGRPPPAAVKELP